MHTPPCAVQRSYIYSVLALLERIARGICYCVMYGFVAFLIWTYVSHVAQHGLPTQEVSCPRGMCD